MCVCVYVCVRLCVHVCHQPYFYTCIYKKHPPKTDTPRYGRQSWQTGGQAGHVHIDRLDKRKTQGKPHTEKHRHPEERSAQLDEHSHFLMPPQLVSTLKYRATACTDGGRSTFYFLPCLKARNLCGSIEQKTIIGLLKRMRAICNQMHLHVSSMP